MRRPVNTIFITMASQPQLVAVRLTELRQAHGLSQEDAAHKVSVGVRTWQRWEAGESMPYPRNIESVAHAFGISVEQFFDGPAQTQLDRIETKLDAVLDRLNEPQSDDDGDVLPAGPTDSPRMPSRDTQPPRRAGHGGTRA